jgi:hypothetical protein
MLASSGEARGESLFYSQATAVIEEAPGGTERGGGRFAGGFRDLDAFIRASTTITHTPSLWGGGNPLVKSLSTRPSPALLQHLHAQTY